MKKKTTGYLFILLTTVIFSTMEVMLRYTRGLFAPMQITYLRFLIGGIALIPFAAASLKKHGAKLAARDLCYFALTGFMCVSFSMVMYQMAILRTSASFVSVAFSSNPVFVTILAALLLKEKIRPNHVIALVIEVIAILVIVAPWNNTLDTTGVILTIAASVAFAFYMILGKKKTPSFGGIVVTCVAGGNLSRGELQNTEPDRYEHPRFIVGADGVVYVFDYFGRRTAVARSVADQEVRHHHKERGGNALAGNIRHHKREVVAVNQKIVIKVAADLLGRLHKGKNVKIFSFRECGKNVRNGVFLNPFCHGKLRTDALFLRCHGGEIFNICQHLLFHFVNGVAQV